MQKTILNELSAQKTQSQKFVDQKAQPIAKKCFLNSKKRNP
jgi:hypothetical protein